MNFDAFDVCLSIGTLIVFALITFVGYKTGYFSGFYDGT